MTFGLVPMMIQGWAYSRFHPHRHGFSNHTIAKVSTDRFDEFLHEVRIFLSVGYVKVNLRRQTELLDEFSDTADVAAESLGHAPADSVIGMRHAAFTWTAADEIKMTFAPSRRVFTLLIEEDLTFKRGCLNLVLGPTGSGKTSLLMALLGKCTLTLPRLTN